MTWQLRQALQDGKTVHNWEGSGVDGVDPPPHFEAPFPPSIRTVANKEDLTPCDTTPAG